MSTEAKVGVFVIVSVLVLGAALYFVRTTQTVRGQVPYRTYLRYAGGLDPGATVLFGGIKVGQVTSVHPWAEDPTRIEILFEVTADTPINQRSTAGVGSVSLMSTPALLITTGSNEAARLRPGQAVPSEEAVSLNEITRQVTKVAESANALIGDLRRDIPTLTREAQAVLANVNAITGPRTQEEITGILIELHTLLNRESPKIAEMTTRISALAAHADAIVLSAQPLVAHLDDTVTNVNQTVDSIRLPLTKDLAELERTLQDARALLATVDRVVRGNEDDITDTVQALRTTSQNLQALSESLKQRPWNLIRTTQPPDRQVPR